MTTFFSGSGDHHRGLISCSATCYLPDMSLLFSWYFRQISRFHGLFLHIFAFYRPPLQGFTGTASLGCTPSLRHEVSPIQLVERCWYDAVHQVRRVRSSGEIMWKDERVFVGGARPSFRLNKGNVSFEMRPPPP